MKAYNSLNLFERENVAQSDLVDNDGPRMLNLSVLNVCESFADLLPDRLAVLQSWNHEVLSHVENSLDRRHNASCASAKHFKHLKS